MWLMSYYSGSFVPWQPIRTEIWRGTTLRADMWWTPTITYLMRNGNNWRVTTRNGTQLRSRKWWGGANPQMEEGSQLHTWDLMCKWNKQNRSLRHKLSIWCEHNDCEYKKFNCCPKSNKWFTLGANLLLYCWHLMY